jgi:diguanylate cyclase (GGDEF)-like protein/PAS domain S-box-containing protein
MKVALPTRVLAGFLLAVMLLAVLAVYLRKRALEFRQYREEVAHTRVEVDALHSYLTTIEDAETGQRGFLLTGNETYLAPYTVATSEIADRLARLAELTKEDPDCVLLMQQLNSLTSAKLDELALAIQKRRDAGLEAALAIVNTDQGNDQMDAIRTVVAEIDRKVRGRQALSEDKYGASVVRTELLFTAAFAGQMFLLLILSITVQSDLKYRATVGAQLSQAHLKLSAVINTIGEGLYQIDEKGKLVFLNPAGEKMLGYSQDEIRGRSMHDMVHAARPDGTHLPEKDCPLVAVIRSGDICKVPEDWFRRKDGSFLMAQCTSAPLLMHGKIEGAVVSFSDIAERHRMEEALRKSEDRYRTLVEKSGGLMCTHDLEGVLISLNKAGASALGYTPEELKGKNLRDLLVPEQQANLNGYLALLKEKGELGGYMKVQSKGGKPLTWSYFNRVVEDGEHGRYVIGSAQDVTAQVQAQADLEEHKRRLALALDNEKSLSRSDHLTHLANRRAFEESLEMECKRSRRYKRPITLVYMDLDDFKKVNDGRGHQTGDQVLAAVAEALRSSLRATDTVARLGGDEFAILLPETDAQVAPVIMKKLNAVLQNLVQRSRWPIGFSFGVISFPAPLDSPEAMLELADKLMYQAKRSGKGATLFQSA